MAGALLAGSVWGLGMARFFAEQVGISAFQVSIWAGVAIAAAFAALAYALYVWVGGCPGGLCGVLPLFFPLLYVVGVVHAPLGGGVLLCGGLAVAALLSWPERPSWVPPVVVGALVGGVYLRTMLPSLGEADTFEFQVVAPLLGIAHPTGYPLYILLGKLFTFIPFGSVAWRVNLSSVGFGTGAVVLLYLLMQRLTGRWLIAFAAALAFGFSETVWSQSIIAEVYSLHAVFVVAILWLLLGTKNRRVSSRESGRDSGWGWWAMAFLFGLSLTNHLTTVLLAPAAIVALAWDRPRLGLRRWSAVAGLALLGLSIYAYIPLRWPALHGGTWMSLRDFIAYVSGGQFHGALRLDGWRDPVRWGIVGRLMLQPYGLVGAVLSVLGVIWLALKDRRALAVTGVTFVAFALYGLSYYVPDISVFLLPAHLILATWMGLGVMFLAETISNMRSAHRIGVCTLAGILFTLLPLWNLWRGLPTVDQSSNTGREEWGRYVLSLPLARDSAVLADVKKFAPLYYVQQIEGVRSDLDIVLLGSEELYQQELRTRLEAGQVVYLARFLPHLEGLRLRSVGPLVEVGREAWRGDVAPQHRADVRFGENLRLVGYDASTGAPASPRALRVMLYWQALLPVGGDYVVRFRLVDSSGVARWESTGERPVSGLYPTNGWHVGEIVSDYHELALPPYLGPGLYRLQISLSPQFSTVALPAGGDGSEWADLREMDLPAAAELPALPSDCRVLFGRRLWLTGYDAPMEALAGSRVSITLGWRAASSITAAEHGADWIPRLTWVNEADEGAVDAEPLSGVVLEDGGRGQTCDWVQVPTHPGSYRLTIALEDAEGRVQRASCRWVAPAAESCLLARIEVVPGQQGIGDFGGLFLLDSASVGVGLPEPGSAVPVSLRWRALRTTDEDFTVFVHLVGPDGRLYGQVDSWPVQGTFPTSQWVLGEDVADVYEVQLDGRSPSGRYRVEVGWYLLATMQRLPLEGESGQVVGDSVVVGGFTVR